jgi:hypothetical protein
VINLRVSLEQLKGKEKLVGAEIGVSIGDNAMDIFTNLNMKTLYLIDPYVPFPSASDEKIGGNQEDYDIEYETVKERFLKYPNVKIIRDFSWNSDKYIKKNSLDFVYEDSDHRPKILEKDIELFMILVKHGGILAGHDFHLKYVKDTVNRYFNKLNIIVNSQDWDWWIVNP